MSSLGKGLSALITSNNTIDRQAKKKTKAIASKNEDTTHVPFKEVPIEDVMPNAFQPRMVITEESLRGLVESIKEHGFFSPILVKAKQDDKYMIIAGERRWRAAKLSGIKKIPIYINDSDDAELLEMALVENLQRKDLNPLEEAMAYDHLRREYNLKSTEIAIKLGLTPEYISHKLRLLRLPVGIQELVLQEKLTPQHTEAIEKLGNEAAMLAVSKMVLRDRLSPDKTAELVQKLMAGMGIAQSTTPTEEFKQRYQYVLDTLKDKLGWRATLTRKQNGGATLSINFGSDEEIKNFYNKIGSIKGKEELD